MLVCGLAPVPTILLPRTARCCHAQCRFTHASPLLAMIHRHGHAYGAGAAPLTLYDCIFAYHACRCNIPWGRHLPFLLLLQCIVSAKTVFKDTHSLVQKYSSSSLMTCVDMLILRFKGSWRPIHGVHCRPAKAIARQEKPCC